MSLDGLQRTMFARVTAGDRALAPGHPLDDPERLALDSDDVGSLWQLGVHPVLLNSYCRLIGLRRDQYRALLEAVAPPADRALEVPWRTS